MSQTMFMNQFNQTPIKGNSATKVNLNTISVVIDPNSTNTLLPGDAVIMTSSTGNVIYVDKCTAIQLPFGYILYAMKTEKFTANMATTIGLMGTIMFGEAGGSITRGSYLEYVPNAVVTGPQMIVSAGINPISAIALDNASNAGIFRFMVLSNSEMAAGLVLALPTTTPISVTRVNNPSVQSLTPTQNMTLNAGALATGKELTFVITTSGTVSFTITFGTNFKSTGTLATGGTTAKVFTISFVCDGVNYNELSRTTAM